MLVGTTAAVQRYRKKAIADSTGTFFLPGIFLNVLVNSTDKFGTDTGCVLCRRVERKDENVNQVRNRSVRWPRTDLGGCDRQASITIYTRIESGLRKNKSQK